MNMTDNDNEDYSLTIQNIVGSGELPVELRTEVLAEGYQEELGMTYFETKEEKEEAEKDDSVDLSQGYTWHSGNSQPGLYYEIDGSEGPQVTFHESGSYIVRADTKSELEEGHQTVISELKELGVIESSYTTEDMNFEIVNVVALAKMNKRVNLAALALGLGVDSQYEPEQFPALQYTKPHYDCSFLVYGNGKIILAGANSEEETNNAMVDFYEEMSEWI